MNLIGIIDLQYIHPKLSIIMVGPALDSLGGIASVAASYRDAGLFQRSQVRYLASYRHPIWHDKIVRLVQSFFLLTAELLRHRVLLIHVHAASRGSFWRKSLFIALGRIFDVPIVLHIHSGEFVHFYTEECSSLQRAIIRWAMRSSDRVLCLASSWKTALGGIEPRARLQILPNPIAARRMLPKGLEERAARAKCVLFLGRLHEKKGVYELLRAWPRILLEYPHTYLVIAGEGDTERVRAEASKLGIVSSVILPGWVTGEIKDEWLRRADILVLPSHAEGLPMCILEAMAAGVAVVATRVGGVPDLIEHGVNGLLVEPGDVYALSTAVLLLLNDTSLRQQIAVTAHERVDREFEVGHVTELLDTVWREVVVAHGGYKY